MNREERNRRLLRKYGITLADYERMLKDQRGRCAICGRLPGKKPLNVDHDHRVVRAKITAEKRGNMWIATAQWGKLIERAESATRKEAVRAVRMAMLRHSIRGLLCAGRWGGCNFRLGRVDDLKWLTRAAEYLRAHERKFG